MNTAYYETECGCLHTRERLVKGKTKQGSRLLCPEHHSIIKYKFGFCKKCSTEIIYTSANLSIPDLCTTCNPVFRRKTKHILKKKNTIKINLTKDQIVELLIERSDCEYRPLCAEIHIKEQQLPCCICSDYKQKNDMQVLIYGLDLKELDSYIKDIFREKNQQEADIKKTIGIEKWGNIFLKRKADLTKKMFP